MSQLLSLKSLEVLITGLDNLGKQDLADLIQCFPYKSLVNVSILDFKSIRLHSECLLKLIKTEVFYKNSPGVKCCLEFILTNLLALENVCVDDILPSLLELLKHFISKIKLIKGLAQDIARDRERIFDILTFTAKLKIFGKVHTSYCTDIICDLLTMGGPIPLTASRNLAEISEIFKGLKAVHELAIITGVVLKKFTISTEVFNVCIPWLLIYGPEILTEKHEDDTILELLKVTNDFYSKYGYLKNRKKLSKINLSECFDEFLENMLKTSAQLIHLSSREKLRAESLKFFSILFCDNCGEEMGVKESENDFFNGISQLSVDVMQWPQEKSKIYFFVCSFLISHSRLIWSPEDILSSISSLIYSYERFSLDQHLLKTLCFIYPILSVEHPNKSTLLLGDELLKIMSKWPCSFSKIHSFHVAQLIWILKRGDCNIRKQCFCLWLENESEMDTVEKVLVQCNIGNILLDIIINKDTKEAVRNKAIELSHKITDVTLSKNVAMLIPATLRHETILNRLIISNPGIPDDTGLSIKMCEFMSLILVSIVEENVLRGACCYCRRLITELKREKGIMPLFCQDIENVKFLTIKVKYVNDETAVEILRLLKILALVQRRNHNQMEEKVDVDLSRSLTGSQTKLEKALDLLQIIVISKDIFLRLDETNIQDTFLNLFSLCEDPTFSVKSFICLTGILRKFEWLAKVQSTCLFVEVRCSLSVDPVTGPEFLLFLVTWLKILRGNSCGDVMLCVPNKATISNYVKRADYISHAKTAYLLQMLNKVNIFPDNFQPKGRNCASLFLEYDRSV